MNNIQHWDKVLKRLKFSPTWKVIALLEHNCIHKLNGYDRFLIEPLKGYNISQYTVNRLHEYFICNCQGWQSKLNRGQKPYCAHTIAVRIYLKQQERNSRVQGQLF